MKNKLSRLAIPYVVWMALFVVIPILIMVMYAFTTTEFAATMDNFARMGTYMNVFVRSFRLAVIATLVCLLIGYPVAYAMAKEGPGFQRVAMALRAVDIQLADHIVVADDDYISMAQSGHRFDDCLLI